MVELSNRQSWKHENFEVSPTSVLDILQPSFAQRFSPHMKHTKSFSG